jgi:hypothetical protein
LSASLWVGLLLAQAACGYHPLYGQSQTLAVSVAAGQVLVPNTNAVQAALGGARAELAAAGRLASASAFPRLTVDVLRVDEVSRAIHVQAGQPSAAGMGVAVVVRARLQESAEQEPTLDTGDVRRAVQISGDADPRVDGAVYDQALRAAAERAGRAAARIALGVPEPSDEAP